MTASTLPFAFATQPRFRWAHIWVSTLVLMPLILLMDQAHGDNANWTGQFIGSAVGWAYFFIVRRLVQPRLSRLMLIGLCVALAGEYLLALTLDMYRYRFENIPFYVPPGHVGAMVVAFLFVREPWVIKHRIGLERVMFAFATVYATTWLWRFNDVYGFILFCAFAAVIFLSNESRTFFLAIFCVTTYMELIGTSLGCWAWHPTLMNRFAQWPGANPPGGISFLYLFFDIGCLGTYLSTNLRTRARYDGQKARRKRARKAEAAVPDLIGEAA